MKSEHRHELKTNELAQWLSDFPQWCKNNISTIITVIAVVVIVISFFGWRYHKNTTQAQEQTNYTFIIGSIEDAKAQIVGYQLENQGSDRSLELLNQAEQLKLFAGSLKNDNMSSLALIKQADAIRAEMHYNLETVSSDYLERKINQARDGYTQAMEKSPSDTAIRALAAFGLGLCAEELGDFDQARQIYNDIIKQGEYDGTVVVNKAKYRLNTMDDYKEELVFEPAPVIEPNIVVEPSVQVIPADVNQPYDSNLPFDISISDINLPAGVNVPTNEILPEQINIPAANSLPIDNNLPAEVNEPIE